MGNSFSNTATAKVRESTSKVPNIDLVPDEERDKVLAMDRLRTYVETMPNMAEVFIHLHRDKNLPSIMLPMPAYLVAFLHAILYPF